MEVGPSASLVRDGPRRRPAGVGGSKVTGLEVSDHIPKPATACGPRGRRRWRATGGPLWVDSSLEPCTEPLAQPMPSAQACRSLPRLPWTAFHQTDWSSPARSCCPACPASALSCPCRRITNIAASAPRCSQASPSCLQPTDERDVRGLTFSRAPGAPIGSLPALLGRCL